MDLQLATRDDSGWRLSNDVPATLPPDEPVVLRYGGPNFFADVTGLAERLPAPDPAAPGVLVIDLGALEHFSSTTLKAMEKIHARFDEAHSGLVLTGVEPIARDVLARTGLLASSASRTSWPSDPHIGASLDAGARRGRELLAELGRRPDDASGSSAPATPA